MGVTLRSTRRSIVLPHAVESVGRARRALREDLQAHGVPAPVVGDACVVLSELVANALRHAAPLPEGGVRVGWEVVDHLLVLRITDGGSRRTPRVTAATAGATGGRGLAIVEELTATWDVLSEPDGTTTVRAVIAIDPD